MSRQHLSVFVFALSLAAACGGKNPVSPTDILTASIDSAHFSYHCTPGDTVQIQANIDRQEAHFSWATSRLGVTLAGPIVYNKYLSRSQMGSATGQYNTNGFAEPDRLTVHTLFPWDNHETVHVFTGLIGRPPDLFNEGIAVAFQTDPSAGDFESRFNGQQVHDATAGYRRQGLVPPLDSIATSDGFRSIADSIMSYRIAGSFVRFLLDREGLDRVKDFFRTGGRNDTVAVVRQHVLSAFGRSLDQLEAEWLAMLDAR